MGANGSFYPKNGKTSNEYTHTNSGFYIDGHKVIILSDNPSHHKTPMNSHSDSPIYFCAKTDSETGELTIKTIAFYKNHKIVKSIDIEQDEHGNLLPFVTKGKGTHKHYWEEKPNGEMGRETHDSKNTFPVDIMDMGLINKALNFNNAKRIWKKPTEK